MEAHRSGINIPQVAAGFVFQPDGLRYRYITSERFPSLNQTALYRIWRLSAESLSDCSGTLQPKWCSFTGEQFRGGGVGVGGSHNV